MTADELLTTCKQAGILLEARGDRIHVQARAGAVTPGFARGPGPAQADAYLRLARPEFVTLKGGLVLPVPAVRLALDLEQRGFRMALDQDQQFTIEPAAGLTDEDRAAIRRWRLHLGAIVSYHADAYEPTQ